MGKTRTQLFSYMRSIVAILTVLAVCLIVVDIKIDNKVKEYQNNMYSIDFLDKNNNKVKVRTDENGIVKDADIDKSFWKEQVIINVKYLKPNDTMTIYNMYSDVIESKEYKIVSISNK